MIDNQAGRRNITDAYRFLLAQAKKAILGEIGRTKKSENGGDKVSEKARAELSIVDNSAETQKHNTRNEIAKDLGWSTGKVAMADKVFKEAAPEIKEQVLLGDISINQAYTEIKKEAKAKNISAAKETKGGINSTFVLQLAQM